MKPLSTVQKASDRGHEILNSKNPYTRQFKDTHYLKAFFDFSKSDLSLANDYWSSEDHRFDCGRGFSTPVSGDKHLTEGDCSNSS